LYKIEKKMRKFNFPIVLKKKNENVSADTAMQGRFMLIGAVS
jgi:hypothetical protein